PRANKFALRKPSPESLTGPNSFAASACPGQKRERGSVLEVLRRRPVARIDRVLQELLLVIRPELAHVRIRIDDGLDEAYLIALDLADVDVAHDVAVHVEGHGPAHRFRLDPSQRFHQSMLVLDL